MLYAEHFFLRSDDVRYDEVQRRSLIAIPEKQKITKGNPNKFVKETYVYIVSLDCGK